VRVLDGSTRCLQFGADDAAADASAAAAAGVGGVMLHDLRARLHATEGIPSEEQLIVCGGKTLGLNDDVIAPEAGPHLIRSSSTSVPLQWYGVGSLMWCQESRNGVTQVVT